MIRYLYGLGCILCLVSACGEATKSNPTNEATTNATTPPNASTNAEKLYPSLPADKMGELYNTVDYIDFVFYYANFSMNQSDDASIKATMTHVSSEVPDIVPSCQPIGSLFFQAQGKELIQAELYYTDQCVYYIWLQNGQRTYANRMTPNGFDFYKKIFTQQQQN